MKINRILADQITLSNGKIFFTGFKSLNSALARYNLLSVERVSVEGCCISENLQQRAILGGFEIKIEGVPVEKFDLADEDAKIE